MTDNSSLLNAAFSAVSNNEVSGRDSIATRISKPINDGKSGWTIGYEQEDFKGNPNVAQATLQSALTASGQFDSNNALAIGKALTEAKNSPNVDLSNITTIDGKSATITNINQALADPAAAASIKSSSFADFSANYQALDETIFQASYLDPSVKQALDDPEQGPLLKIELADFFNQYGSTRAAMIGLLTTGESSVNGNTITLDKTNSESVTNGIMTFALDTGWVSKGNGVQATNRLTNVVAAAGDYEDAEGFNLLTDPITVQSQYGSATITPGLLETDYFGQWSTGSFKGKVTSAGTSLDLSGTGFDLDVNGYTLNLSDGASGNLFGDYNTIIGGKNVNLKMDDTNNAWSSVSLGAGSTLQGNLDGGGSALENFSPNYSITNEFKYYFGLNGTGAETKDIIDYKNGHLDEIDFNLNSNAAGQIGSQYDVQADGTKTFLGYTFGAAADGTGSTSFSQLGFDAASLGLQTNSNVGLDTATGPINNSLFPLLNVSILNNALGTPSNTSEVTGSVANGIVTPFADAYAGTGNNSAGTNSIANTDGLFSNSPTDILTGNYRPGNQVIQTAYNNVVDLVSGIDEAATNFIDNASASASALVSKYLSFSDVSSEASHLINTDPLLIDLTGNGIQVTNWIKSPTYFDTNVGSNGKADGQLHRTSWVQSGTGILAIDLNGDGKINDITETLSEYFQGGTTPGTYTDGLGALANLATAGATVFNATTSRIDTTTGKSFWSEIKVWQDANQDGVTDAGELQSLSALGVASISLVGNGNQGENINGSDVTNRTTYTMTNGATGQVAAVNLQTDTTGDVVTTANGGITITSSPEGGANATNSYVDQSSTARGFILNHGVLNNIATGATVTSGIAAFFATTQGDTVAVDGADTTSYWLGAGAEASTLNGGAGNTMFLINHLTSVHGGGVRGQNFNIAQVIDTAPITVDLKTDNLDEVIGGAGNGVFNASGTTWNVFIQGGSGNNIIIGGAAHDALSGGTGDDLIEAGSGGSVIHAGSGNDVIFGGSGTTTTNGVITPNSDIIYGGPGHDTVVLGTNNTEVVAGTGTMSVIGNASGFSVLRLQGSFADYTVTHNADGTTTITDKLGRNGAVTFTNISAYDFADVNQIPVADVNPLPVNDTVSVSGKGPYVIAASTLLANDVDYAGKPISIRELVDINGNPIAKGASGQANGGTVSLSSDGKTITFTPQSGFTGVASFRYHVQDNSGNNGAMVQQTNAPTSTAEITGTVSLLTPTDPTNKNFAQQWYLPSINVLPVWAQGYTGEGVSIGVFDPSGNIDFTNPGLTANEGGEFKADGTPGIQQIGTHATLVGGVIAGVEGGQESVGVAYNATLSSEAITGGGNVDLANGYSVLSDWAKYDIVNNSWGLTPAMADNFLRWTTYASYFSNAAKTGRDGLGTIIVFAGGNDRATGGNTNYSNSTNSQYEITVGGINAPSDLGSLQISGKPFSNPGASILVSAPANNITSTGVTMTNEYGQEFGADSQTVAGTSMAAPIVSGVIALMLEANPKLGARDVQEILALTAKQVDTTGSNWTYNGAVNWNGGGMHASDDYGFGEVDAAAAVRLAKSWTLGDTFNNESAIGYTGGNAVGGFTGDSTGIFVPVDQGGNTPYIDVNLASVLSGITMRVQHIDVEISLSQVRLSDITIKLVSGTSGETSVLLKDPKTAIDLYGNTVSTQTPDDYQFTFDTVKDWGEVGNSDYHVVISYDAGTTPTGYIANPLITTAYGDISGTDTEVYTDEFANLGSDTNNAARSILNDAASVSLNAAAVSSATVLDLRAGSTDSIIAGRSLTIGATTTRIIKAYGGAGNDTIIGNDVGDALYGGISNDSITGGAGNDTIGGGGGADKLYGGAGSNTISYAWSTTGVTANLASGTDSTGSKFTNFQNILGSDIGDSLTGSSVANVITGGAGNDTIQGMGGADTLNGGSGNNTISYAWSTAAVTSNLATGTDSTGSTLTNFQNVIASSYGDTLTTGSGVHVLTGGAGNDTFQVSTLAAGSIIDGGAGTNNLVITNGDISNALVSNIQNITINGTATLSVAESLIAISGTTYSFSVSDSGANILANLAALQTLATGTKLTSIKLTDAVTPLSLTTGQYATYANVLNKITGTYSLSISGVMAANATTMAAATHVISISVNDTSANTLTNMAALQTLAVNNKLTAIAFTDTSAPTWTLTAAQLTADSAALSKINSPYALVITGVTAANATTIAGNKHVTSLKVSDSAADIVTNLTSLETLATGNKLGAIALTDTATPTINLTAAQLAADTAALGKISSAYNLAITAVTGANAVTVAATAHVTSIAVSDNAANIVANLVALQTLTANSKLSAIKLTDNTTPTMAITASQLTADAATLAKISSTYNLAISGVTAANASTIAGTAHVISLTVNDTAANVAVNIAALQTLGSKLSGILLTDTATPTMNLTAAQLSANAGALVKISSAYNLAISGVLAANAASVAGNIHVTSMAVSDTAANVLAKLASLQTLATGTKLTNIILTDVAAPTIAVTAAQLTADATALAKIISPYSLTVSSVTAANASVVAATAHVASLTVSDTAANVVANIASLQTLASGKLGAITLTDKAAPTITLTASQLTTDATALNKISSAYTLTITGVTAANATTVAGASHVGSIIINDSAANVATNIAALQTLISTSKLNGITLTDTATPTMSLTATQLSADAAVLAKISSAYNLTITGVTASTATGVAATAHVTTVTISDSAANIVTNLAALQALGTKLNSIALTDTTTPTMTLTAAQLGADATALTKISGTYNLTITSVAAANAATVAAIAHVTSLAVSDTAINIAANLAALQTLSSSAKLTGIVLTDTVTPTMAITAAQWSADATALAKITSTYNLAISGVTAANATSVSAAAHVTAIVISDTAANILSNMAALQKLATGTKLSAIILTDSATPTVALTAAQLTADTAVLAKISSAYNLTISGVTAANAASVAANANVTSLTVSDTAANVLSNMPSLQTLATGTKLSAITFTGSTPTLALTATQLSADAAVLAKITSAYNLTISGVAAVNATSVAAMGHVTTVAISDTAANVVTNLMALQTLASKLTGIVLIDTVTPTLNLTAAQLTADAGALAKISGAYNLAISDVTAANAVTVAKTAHVTGLTVNDAAANVVSNIVSLESLAVGTKLTAITLNDTATPTLNLTASQLTTDSAVLNKISSSYNLTITGVPAANATNVSATAHVSGIVVNDTAAHVQSYITALQSLVGSKLNSITLTDTTAPTMKLTAAQLISNAGAFNTISSAYNLAVSAVAATDAASIAGNAHVTSMAVSDAAANVATHIDALQAAINKLTAITLTDTTTPTMSLTAAQLTADTAVLAKISSSYNLAITAASAANAATLAGTAHVTTVAVSDTAANVLNNITALQTLTTNNKLSAITLTDSTAPTWTLTATQLAADTGALAKITSAYNLLITGVSAANATAIAATAHVLNISVSDVAANVAMNMDALQTLGSKLTSITLTDTATPMAISAVQLTADKATLAKITSAYNLIVTGVTVAASASIAAAAHVTSVGISDSAANVLHSIASLQTLASNNKLSNIVLTDSTAPTWALTAAQLTADATALAKISSPYNLTISGVTAANATNVLSNTHVLSITVSDSAANVFANLSTLQTLNAKITIIGLTDTTRPTLSLTAAQLAADAAALAKISNSYNLTISVVTAANAASVAATAHVVSMIVSDSATNVVANLAALQTLGAKLTSITLTDTTTPTLNLTATQFTADATALAKISNAYNLVVSAATAASAATVATNTHVTSITVNDAMTNVVKNLTSLQTLATGTKLSAITLTDVTPPSITLTATQVSADAAALAKISGVYNLTVSGVTAANALSVAGIAHVTNVTVSDSAANVLSNITALQTLASSSKLGAVTLTDSPAPTLALTAAQVSADAAALSKITSTYHVTVSDTALNVSHAIDAIQTLASSGKLTAITLTDTAIPTLNVTVGQTVSDALALSKITSPYNEAVNGTTANDTLVNVTQTTALYGNGGNDLYKIGITTHNTTINNGLASNTGATGELDINAAHTKLWFTQAGNNLDITIMGTSQQVILSNWYNGGTAKWTQLQEVVGSDHLKIDTQVQSLVQAMATYSSNHTGFNPTTSTTMPTDSALQTALAASWHA